MWSKALLAVTPAALFIAAPAPVHAGGECTALAPDVDAYNQCMAKANVRCVGGGPTGVIQGGYVTCTYPDGGRDECVAHYAFLSGQLADAACTYIPPGPAPAPAPGAEPR